MSTSIRAGLEIHQQLETQKLFCSCASTLSEEVLGRVWRKLRVTSSELGEIDEAARLQSEKGKRYVYEITGNSCLVELDEEPPHPPNQEALRLAIEVAELLHSSVVEEIHFMRKIVVDGSNTTGFQRTALVALGGWVDVGEKRVRIQSICLEEDACRKISENDEETVYRLDRLGIPLLEISTEPDIDSPELLKAAARKIGMLLRATGKVKRGIGTIREDVNISVPEGARVEIKGVQELDMLPLIAEKEAARQRRLIECTVKLRQRGASVSDNWIDITDEIKTQSRVLDEALKRGWHISAILLKGFSGVLSGREKMLGTEIAQRLRVFGIRGIMHSDELPGYGVTERECAQIFQLLGGADGDAFVICAAPPEKLPFAFSIIRQRALEALHGVPEETREAMPDGSTVYSRPLPGRARMYPETDVLPLQIPDALIEEIRKELPEPFEVQAERITARFGIHPQQSIQIAEEGYAKYFEEICSRYGNASVMARALLNHIPEAERELKKEFGSLEFMEEIMKALAEGRFAKEAVGEIIRCVLESGNVQECISRYSSAGTEATDIIHRIVMEHRDLVAERGDGAFSPLMGLAMNELRGKLDGKKVSQLLLSEIKRVQEHIQEQ